MKTDTTLIDLLKKGIKDLQLEVDDNQIAKLVGYMQILIKWNKVYNLTAIVEPEEIITRHLLDSLSITPYVHGDTVLDIGSGAGLPGIPCAVTFPEKNFFLLDSNGKKTRFMTQVVGELKIHNVKVIQNRVEDYKPENCFDTIMARAFSSIEKILSVTKHLCCKEGELLLMKGAYPEAELQNIGNNVKVYPLTVPGLNEKRHLVYIKGIDE